MNNSSRDEIHSKNSRIHLDRLQNKYTNCKGAKNNTNFGQITGYKRNWIQHVNRMSRNRLPRVMKHYSPTGRRKHGRPLKRLLDMWDRNGSTSGPTPWKIYGDDDNDDDRHQYRVILGGSSILWEMVVLVIGGKESSYVPLTNSEWLLN